MNWVFCQSPRVRIFWKSKNILLLTILKVRKNFMVLISVNYCDVIYCSWPFTHSNQCFFQILLFYFICHTIITKKIRKKKKWRGDLTKTTGAYERLGLYGTANDPETGNDPQNGPQMILNRKWSPKSTTNDPERKIGKAWTQVCGSLCEFYYYYKKLH